MRYKLLACKIFEREIASVVANCPNNIDVTTIRQRLHDYPSNLRQQLQDEIDQIDSNTHRQTDENDGEHMHDLGANGHRCSRCHRVKLPDDE